MFYWRSTMLQLKAFILANEQIGDRFWRITIAAPQIASTISPGQFVNLKISPSVYPFYPLLRRPFTVLKRIPRANPSAIEIVYEIVGKGTKLMTKLRKGDELDLIGPLGQGFSWKRFLDKEVHVLVGGGIGSAALFMLAEEISQMIPRYNLKLVIFIDARTKDELVLEADFKTLPAELRVATHDGQYGYHGYVTQMLEDYLDKEGVSHKAIIYACGPEVMYHKLQQICRHYGVPAQISLERHMGCGIGACLSCVCKVRKKTVMKYRNLATSHIQFVPEKELGYALVCKDGPVFNIEEVEFDE